jgi:hypothetical protein
VAMALLLVSRLEWQSLRAGTKNEDASRR